ncbi:hypothetical protein [Endozoicomonas atrinae]|nr:hypothetical protein [Endozoicomonas atrinae]
MPGVSGVYVSTSACNQVQVAAEDLGKRDVLETLNHMSCHCGRLDVNGKRVKTCEHVLCRVCLDNHDRLEKHTGCSSCVNDKNLTEYTCEEIECLRSLKVKCSEPDCNIEKSQEDIDAHIATHSNSPQLTENPPSVMQPEVVIYANGRAIPLQGDSAIFM